MQIDRKLELALKFVFFRIHKNDPGNSGSGFRIRLDRKSRTLDSNV